MSHRSTSIKTFARLVTLIAPLFANVCVAEENIELRALPLIEKAVQPTFSISGPLGKQIDGVVVNWLLVAPEKNPAMLDMFADRDQPPYRNLLPWSGEFAGKYLTACSQVISLTQHEALRGRIERFVSRLVTLQDDDGYLGPFPKAHRLTGTAPHAGSAPTWDGWGHYHLMLGLLMWHRESKDPAAFHCAKRIGDLLCDRFLAGPKRIFDMGSPDQNQAVIHSLCLLYEATREKRYLSLAEQIVKEFEITGAGDYMREALKGTEFHATPKPRWESLHAILGLIELYRINGNADFRRAFEQIWWSIAKLDRHNNGGFSSGERAIGNPYDRAPIETCCTIAWLAMTLEMLRTTGDSIFADEMELTTWNSIIGMHSADGAWSTYNTPMDGRRIPNTKDISFQIRPGSEQLNCCSVNAARGFGILSEWALMTSRLSADGPAALYLNWYAPSTMTTLIAGESVRLEQTTEYPRNGHVVITVAPQKTRRFVINLRIPHWSEQTRIVVNDRPIVAERGSYCAVDREWKAGDQIVIDFDMPLRAWIGERESTGKASLYRGPILFACETRADTGKVSEALDLDSLRIESIDAPSNGALISLHIVDGTGQRVRLRDFGTAGQNGEAYVTWLPARGGKVAAFEKKNPLRTSPIRGVQ